MSIESLTPQKKMQAARLWIFREKAYYSYPLCMLRPSERAGGGRVACDASGCLRWDPEFAAGMSVQELSARVVRELLRVSLGMLRFPPPAKVDLKLWRTAENLKLDAYLVRDGMPQPPGGLPVGKDDSFKCEYEGEVHTLDRLRKRGVREVYHWLGGREVEPTPDARSVDPSDYQVEGGRPMTPEEADGDDLMWKKTLITASAIAKARGFSPGAMEDFVNDTLHPLVDWRTWLVRHAARLDAGSTTWRRPGRRSQALGVYMPSVDKEGIDMVAHIDSSGSTQAYMETFFSELRAICALYSSVHVTLITCDAKVQGVYDVSSTTYRQFSSAPKALGGGGTSHTPVVEWVNKNKPDCKVFLTMTDGASNMHAALPDLPSQCERLILLADNDPEKFRSLGDVMALPYVEVR